MVTAGIFPFQENSHGRAGNRTQNLMISSAGVTLYDVDIIILLYWNIIL